jgi:hypothetical protein
MITSLPLKPLFFFQLDARAEAHEQNIDPGTVVDTTVVSPNVIEFFLNSHRVLQVPFV